METGSPWSTPTQSEIGEAESQLKYLSDVDLKLGVERKLMVRELGDGEPCDVTAFLTEEPHDTLEIPVDDGLLKDKKNMSTDEKEGKGKRKSRNKSKSPLPPSGKDRKASLSPTKRKQMDQQNTGEEDAPKPRGAKGRLARQQSLPHNPPDEQESPTKGRGRLRRQNTEKMPMANGSTGMEPKSGASTATTVRTTSTANTDITTSSNSSGNNPPSPTKSPTKKGAKTKARDVLQLPKPYNMMKSDTIKRWNNHLEKGTPLDGDEKDYQQFKQVEFTHALVLKVNQLSKQGLLDRKTCFKYVCNVARYVIPDHDVSKCMTSFYMYARELSNIRESIKTPEQKNMFDLEQSGWIPPTFPKPYVQQTISARPATSKPRDPDSYDFKDEQLAKDYRKMWDKYHQMEALLKQKAANPDDSD